MSTASYKQTSAYKDMLDVWKTGGKPIVIWAGAGLSAPSKLPTWATLRKNLEKEVRIVIGASRDTTAQRRKALLEASIANLSPWKAFELLEEALGAASFQSAITRELRDALKCTIPQAYAQLWNLRIKGFLTLNIDRLAYRAYHRSEVASAALIERNGFEVRSLLGNITQNQSKFIANLHGQIEDPTNWVFTDRKLSALLAQNEYTEFLRDCIKYCTLVLIGITATDKAVIDHFIKARHDLLNFGPHFWISDSDDFDAITTAEEAGIRVVTYKNADGLHSELLDILKDVRQFVPRSEKADPVAWDPRTEISSQALTTSPTELLLESPNALRELLNREAKRILSLDESQRQVDFAAFCRTYSRPILLASTFEPDTEDANEVLGYRLTSFRKEGGFGKVWHGLDSQGSEVAIKAFRYEIRERPELLDAFRRGVRSMRYLERRGVQGIVKFLAASEIPPVVVMEWIEGATLHDAVLRGGLTDWATRIWTLKRLAEIVYAAHNAPERVLHRDLRPQNIMLRDYYNGEPEPEVVVLDFDLSWHVGALEKSVYVAGGTAYLAPEQLLAQPGATTRSAAVDSFGFGMTAFFSISKSDPIINIHLRSDWLSTLQSLASQNTCRAWRSMPQRFVRLIHSATMHNQLNRLSFAEIVAEIELLSQLIKTPVPRRSRKLTHLCSSERTRPVRSDLPGKGSRGPWNKCGRVIAAFMPRKPLDALDGRYARGSAGDGV